MHLQHLVSANPIASMSKAVRSDQQLDNTEKKKGEREGLVSYFLICRN